MNDSNCWILDKVRGVVGREHEVQWQFFLWGLFLSGLRLVEAVKLSWDYDEEAISLDLEGKYPMFRIPGDTDKSRRQRLLPASPEFIELLQKTVPEEDRHGRVFNPSVAGQWEEEPNDGTVGEKISAIGKAAGVKVTAHKYASAHDLRRSFAVHWSRRVDIEELQLMMRHSDIDTTREYYAPIDPEDVAAKLHSIGADSRATVPQEQM